MRLIALLVLLALAVPSFADTIGIENRNPGNIISKHPKHWGAVGRDPWGHLVFPTNEAGLRAIRANLIGYRKRKIRTVGSIVRRWMPYNEKRASNRNYLFKVKQRSGFSENEVLDMRSEATLFRLTRGIVFGENGHDPYTFSEYAAVFGYSSVISLSEGMP